MGNATRFGIYRIIILFFILHCGVVLNAQENDLTDRWESFNQIQQLKNGALVVRLRTNDKKIELYKNAGKESLAEDLRLKQLERNQKMLNGIKAAFDFCPVYFIYADDYTKLLNGERDGMFLNERLEVDNSIYLDELNFFFCDFSPVYVEAISNPNEPRNKVVSSTPAFHEALVIKGKDLEQLLSPFPVYAKVLFNDFEDAAKRLNKDCYKFYGKAVIKTSNEQE